MQRIATLIALLLFGLLAWWGVTRQDMLPAAGEDARGNGRISFQIATGPSGSTVFTLGQAIAGLISHPRGAVRCETSTVCGPSGLIVSARTAQNSPDNLRAVNRGLVDSALVQADMADAAARGTGPFRREGKLSDVTVIAALFPEEVHLVATLDSGITSLRGLSRKRVWLAPEGTDAGDTTRAILSAFRLSVRTVEGDPEKLMADGAIDAFFVTAAAPYGPVAQALESGKARLVPLEGAALERLLRQQPQLQHALIPAEAYRGWPQVPTIAIRTLWVVNAKAPDALVYGITRALFNPANREALAGAHPSAYKISQDSAVLELPMSIHPGARRFYREAGVLAR